MDVCDKLKRPGRFTPGKDPQCPLNRRLGRPLLVNNIPAIINVYGPVTL
jgi:hypothetical protein